ncbi:MULTISPECIES: hypothetical protein [Comamonas]|uniref:hypothetical protein n=1 Tax=Comamonas TaxID=283 RepID=UPI00257D3553|nr:MULTISPECIES: hypothetical protein [Comamonas]
MLSTSTQKIQASGYEATLRIKCRDGVYSGSLEDLPDDLKTVEHPLINDSGAHTLRENVIAWGKLRLAALVKLKERPH